MTGPVISLMPVRAGDLTVGKPLQRAVYDWHGKLLLAAGCVIESQNQIDELMENGFIQDASWDLIQSQRPPSAPPMTSMKKAGRASVSPEMEEDGDKEVTVNMEDVRWFVGENLYLQLADNPGLRYTVRLIGFVRNKTVFVTAPAIDGKFEFIRDGQMFIVRAFSGKKAYAFVAAAVKSVHSPHPYLHLSYPKEVRCTVVRRGVRAVVKIIAAVSLGLGRTAGATLTDLSMGGASGTARQVLGKKGEEGQIKFRVHAVGQDEYLNLKTVLRSIAPSESGNGYQHGFEFLDVAIHERLILSAFVHQTLAEGE
jgi:hypothetical protein